MTIGTVKQVDIDQEMQVAYLDYAMSVIVARALPDVRDGLKPVHRRILYAMHDLGLTSDKPHKKSARIVGEVLGKYHPHGDVAVYDAMVRMAQDFSLRYMLVDGQGNFGSIDGDNAAAMRYTEARLAKISQTMLADIEKDTVAFGPNFDETLREPSILPARLPNLLVNGASGIAVGMSTNIPPHNLGEVCDALVYMIDYYEHAEEITIDHLMQFIQGPDFPTGGLVFRYGKTSTGDEDDLIAQSYAVGKGRFVIQAKTHLEDMSRSRSRIVVTELPFQTNKTRLIERIAELVRDGRLEGVSDLRDESDRTGMRIVIELTRTVDAREVLANLFKLTPMQQTFGVSLLALVDGEPRMLSLKKILIHYIEHRREIIRRRSEYDLARARQRAHIVEGLLIALKNLDEVIQIIRRSRTTDTARANLQKRFDLSEIQAQAILDMPLKRLAQLERKKLEDEYSELLRLIAELETLLASEQKILLSIRNELLELKQTYGDARRTQIVDRTKGTLTAQDLLPDQEVWVTVAADGTCARRFAGNVTAAVLRDLAPVADVALVTTNTRNYLGLFTRDGRSIRVGIHRLAEGSGGHYADLGGLTRRDRVTAAVAVPRDLEEGKESTLTLVTRAGKAKRVSLADYLNVVNDEPVAVMNLDDKDELGWVWLSDGQQDVLLVTQQGKAIRFKEEEVRAMGLPAGGVNAVRLGARRDEVIAAGPVAAAGDLLTATQQGYLKRSALADFPTQGRAGGGVAAHSLTSRTGPLVAATVVQPEGYVAVRSSPARFEVWPMADIPQAGRSTQGKAMVMLGRDAVVDGLLTLSPQAEASPDNGTSPPEPTPPPGGRARSRASSSRKTATARPKARSTGKGKATAGTARTDATAAGKGARATGGAEKAPAAETAATSKKKGTATSRGPAARQQTLFAEMEAPADTRGNKPPGSRAKEPAAAAAGAAEKKVPDSRAAAPSSTASPDREPGTTAPPAAASATRKTRRTTPRAAPGPAEAAASDDGTEKTGPDAGKTRATTRSKATEKTRAEPAKPRATRSGAAGAAAKSGEPTATSTPKNTGKAASRKTTAQAGGRTVKTPAPLSRRPASASEEDKAETPAKPARSQRK